MQIKTLTIVTLAFLLCVPFNLGFQPSKGGAPIYNCYGEFNVAKVPCTAHLNREYAGSWIVDDDGPADFSTIQEAINFANDGDSIFVRNGTYLEHLILNKTLTLIGESRLAVVDGNGTGTTFNATIPSNHSGWAFNLTGFTFRNADVGVLFGGWAGHYLTWSQSVAISDNNIEYCKLGMTGDYFNGTITNNLFLDNLIAFSGNHFALLEFTSNSILFSKEGFVLSGPMYGGLCNFSSNRVVGNAYGVEAFRGAIVLYGNVFDCNDLAVTMGTNDPVYHNNFINNTQDIFCNFPGIWDMGYPTGGNYWDDYSGVDQWGGRYQNETGSDGIGDNPFVIDQNNTDNYPFMKPLAISVPSLPSMPLHPLSRFSYSPDSPSINDTITFDASRSADIDGTIVEYKYDFGDGTNISGTQSQTTHIYSSSGNYTVTLTVTDNDSLNDTETKTITVGKVKTTISLSASEASVTYGKSIFLSGSIYPGHPEINLTIYFRLLGQSWQSLANITAATDIGYMYMWAPLQPEHFQLKANWTGDEYRSPAESTIIDVVCNKIGTVIPVSTRATSTFVGFRVNITGTLHDEYGEGLQGETVVFYYTFSGINSWTPITSDNTKAGGTYSVTWIPPATGYFRVKVEWAGNATYSEAWNETTFTWLSYNDQYVFTVESNSTISNLVFDSQNLKLTFNAAGENGTTAYTRISIAKSLIADPTKLRFLVDGLQHDYTASEQGDAWIIMCTYHQSSHSMELDLKTAITTGNPLDPTLIYIITAVAAAILIGGIILARRRKLKFRKEPAKDSSRN